MDRLRRNRGVVRAAATRLITSATEALQLENPAPADLQVILDDLQDKDTTLADLNKKIADLMTDGAEYEEELTASLEYHDKIRNTMSPSEYAVILHRVLMRSLPEDIAILYRQRMKETETNNGATPRSRQEEVRDVMKFLQIQIESREESSRSRCLQRSSPTGHDRSHTRLQPLVPSALALAAGSATNSHACCVLCGHRDHSVKDCQTTMTADEIRGRLIERSCCFKCAREGHTARQCRNAAWLKCKHCAKRHLTVLCEIWKPQNRAIATSSDTTKTDSVSVTTSAPASSSTPPSPAVLMQTATVWASGRHDSVLVRILLDTGSQKTFVRRDLSTSLDLPSVGTEDLSLLTFGSSKRSRTHRYRTVQLKLQSRFDAQEITMDALEVPEVCTVKTPAIEQGLLMQFHERKMLIADEQWIGDRPTQTISVIIGSDNYWRIVTGKIERLSNDLCAVETIFGWLVQGIYQVDTANDLHQGNYSTSALFLSCELHSQAASCMGDPTEMWRLDAIGITDPPEATGAWDQEPLSLFRQLFGFPRHYTDVGNISLGKRRQLLGKAWSVPVVCHILRPLRSFFRHSEATA
ncbi:hypothetical protein MTO96_042227 [Rhipicephalus appendiculatus]